MIDFVERVQVAHGDAGQAEGRVRAAHGGGAAQLPGIRLMASGLPHAQWNHGDVSDPARVDWTAVRAWYAARAGGKGVPWGVQVPAGTPLPRGRFLFRKRCMGLPASDLNAATLPAGVTIRRATAGDLAVAIAIDSAAFGAPPQVAGPWLAPRLAAPGFTVAIASLDDEPVAIGTAILTNEQAGACVGIFGVAVLDHARRRGIAGGLTSWLVERAFGQGATLAHLHPDSDAAQRVYARLGFVETAGLDIYTDL